MLNLRVNLSETNLGYTQNYIFGNPNFVSNMLPYDVDLEVLTTCIMNGHR